MKVLIILLLFISTSTLADPEKRNKDERRKARIERKAQRATYCWDERTGEQKRHDCKALVFLAVGAV